MVAAAVLLVRSVEHPTSLGCLRLRVFTFESLRAAQQLLWRRQSRGEGEGRLMHGRLPAEGMV